LLLVKVTGHTWYANRRVDTILLPGVYHLPFHTILPQDYIEVS